MEPALVALCALLGLVFGSFANVVIHRVPAGESIVRPPSACPRCGNAIAPRDNIPVVSWLLLRGRCRHCREPIPGRYPAVEIAMAALFAAVGWRVGLDWALPAFLLFAWLLAVVAVIDAQTRKIPNRLTYPLTPALAVLLAVAAVASGQPGRLVPALVGGVAGFGALLLLAIVQPRGMGIGDVKLAGFIGLGLGYLGGWPLVLLGLFGGFLLGGVVAVTLVATRLRRRRDLIPFGPYLSAGAVVALLFGEPIIDAYLRSMGLR
ncbi:MAG TPA: prepilin peptidase [Egibacteraceae bacterium]|nr:prepilin peptidase [Egibacteraceae bacterium]